MITSCIVISNSRMIKKGVNKERKNDRELKMMKTLRTRKIRDNDFQDAHRLVII